jgi:hypothetical protein
LVGKDLPELDNDSLRTTLIEASEADLEIFDGKQRFLNCKTLERYADAFVV